MALEVLEAYMELAEHQNETILNLTKLIRKQIEEICQLRGVSMDDYIDFETDLDLSLVGDITKEYKNLTE